MSPRNPNPDSAVLVLLKSGDKVLDSGTGIVLCHDKDRNITFVLTCAHNLRALGRRPDSGAENAAKIFVNGQEASSIEDKALQSYDLVVLKVPLLRRRSAQLKSLTKSPAAVSCVGFLPLIHQEFAQETVSGDVKRVVQTLTSDGLSISYLMVQTKRGSSPFNKGLSGGPLYDGNGVVVGVARLLLKVGKEEAVGYAIQISPELVSLIDQIVAPCDVTVVGKKVVGKKKLETDRPPVAPEPRLESRKIDDIQKNRWGGKSSGFGYRVCVENVELYRSYFVFDAVLQKTEGMASPEGPFIFHLHDTFPKSVIWIRKARGSKAVLEEIRSIGTFTFGVQFKDDEHKWQSLEYDLAEYEDGILTKYD
jgi:hypothetical protein